MYSALAAHLVQIVVLEEVVSEPPLGVCDARVRQLHLKDGILPGGHSGVAKRPEDAHTLCGQTGRTSKVTLPEVSVKTTQNSDSTASGNRSNCFLRRAKSYSGDRSYIKISSRHLLCFPVEQR